MNLIYKNWGDLLFCTPREQKKKFSYFSYLTWNKTNDKNYKVISQLFKQRQFNIPPLSKQQQQDLLSRFQISYFQNYQIKCWKIMNLKQNIQQCIDRLKKTLKKYGVRGVQFCTSPPPFSINERR